MENKLGIFLKEKRGEMSLRDFANKLDISHTYLDSLEKGYDNRTKKPVRITVDTLYRIAKALNEPLEKLVLLSVNEEYVSRNTNQHSPIDLKTLDTSDFDTEDFIQLQNLIHYIHHLKEKNK